MQAADVTRDAMAAKSTSCLQMQSDSQRDTGTDVSLNRSDITDDGRCALPKPLQPSAAAALKSVITSLDGISPEAQAALLQVVGGLAGGGAREEASTPISSPMASSLAEDQLQRPKPLPGATGDAGSGYFPAAAATADEQAAPSAPSPVAAPVHNDWDQTQHAAADGADEPDVPESAFASMVHQYTTLAPADCAPALPGSAKLMPSKSYVTYKTKALAAAAGAVRTGPVGSSLRFAGAMCRSSSGSLADILLSEAARAESGLLTAGLPRADSLPERNLVATPAAADLAELASLRDLDFGLSGLPTVELPSLTALFEHQPAGDIFGLAAKDEAAEAAAAATGTPQAAAAAAGMTDAFQQELLGSDAAAQGPPASAAASAEGAAGLLGQDPLALPAAWASNRALGRPRSFTASTVAALFGGSSAGGGTALTSSQADAQQQQQQLAQLPTSDLIAAAAAAGGPKGSACHPGLRPPQLLGHSQMILLSSASPAAAASPTAATPAATAAGDPEPISAFQVPVNHLSKPHAPQPLLGLSAASPAAVPGQGDAVASGGLGLLQSSAGTGWLDPQAVVPAPAAVTEVAGQAAAATAGGFGGFEPFHNLGYSHHQRLPLLMERQDTFDVLLRQVDMELAAEAEARQYAALEFDTMDVMELPGAIGSAAAVPAAAAPPAALAPAGTSTVSVATAMDFTASAAEAAATAAAPPKRRSAFEGLRPASVSDGSFGNWLGGSASSASAGQLQLPAGSPFCLPAGAPGVPALLSEGGGIPHADSSVASAAVAGGGQRLLDSRAAAVGVAHKQEVARYSRVITCKTYLKRLNITQPMAEHLLPYHNLNASTSTASASARAADTAAGDESPRRPGSSYELLFKEEVSIVDEVGASFRVQYEGVSCNAQKHLRLTSGWRDFIRAHNVAVGDSIIFERRGDERRVLYVTVVKGGGPMGTDDAPATKKRRVSRSQAVQRLS